jgi:subtilase family serine protease
LNVDASYGSETTWSGSGAGSSTLFSKPTWQQGLGDSMRDIVDVSYDGDPNTGVLVVQGGLEYQVGGTSAGSPQWAALMDLASQANGQSYGSANAKLYKLSSYHDISTGSDSFFAAGSGWDYPTGFGTPDANLVVTGLSPAIQVPLNSSIVFEGVKVHTTGSIGILSTNRTLSGTASVVAANSTTGTILFNKTYTIPNIKLSNMTGTLQGSFVLSIGIGQYPLSSNIIVKDTAGNTSASIGITRRVDVNGDGKVDILDLAFVASAFGSTLNSPSYDGHADVDGNGTVDITDLATIAFYFTDQDFT